MESSHDWTIELRSHVYGQSNLLLPHGLGVNAVCVALICHCWGGSEFQGAQVLFENHSCNTLKLPPRDGCEESIVHL